MNMPMPLSDFPRLAGPVAVSVREGLSPALDAVARNAPETHRFLRFAWFAAALETYGGAARTMVVTRDGTPLLALPMVRVGPRAARLMTVPGSYWPFRGFPAVAGAGRAVFDAAIVALAREVRVLRIGPVPDDDTAAAGLIEAARRRGWAVIDRVAGQTFRFDLAGAVAAGGWPRNSTLRKNRFHEKHLAEHGTLDWHFVAKAAWPAAFEAFATVEQASWIAQETDGRDAKFTMTGHGGFWRAAAADPVLATMFHAAVLEIDGRAAAFSFDIDSGATRYAIANSYDPIVAKHSPGKLLYYRNLIEARDHGTATVDWGMGDGGYKQTIGAVEGPMLRDWLLIRPGPLTYLSWPIARAWRRRARR